MTDIPRGYLHFRLRYFALDEDLTGASHAQTWRRRTSFPVIPKPALSDAEQNNPDRSFRLYEEDAAIRDQSAISFGLLG